MKRITGSKKEERAGQRRKLDKVEFRNLYSLQNTVKMIKLREIWTKRVAFGRVQKCVQNVTWKVWREITTWKKNIKMDFKEVRCKDVD